MKEIDDNLLTEFLEGKLDEPANREIENWYDTSEENRRRLEALYFVLFAGDRLRAAASVNTDQAFRSLQRRIELRRTKDIAAELGREKGGRLLVGFALETENGAANAREKLDRKNLDFIVLNSLRDAGAGFGCDTNVVSLIDRVSCVELPLMSKREVAARIVDRMEVRIDSEDPENKVGEILVKGMNVMLGYYKNPEATKAVMMPDGWMRTGDLGTLDKDGFLYIRGRSKTMILGPSGQNIYPEEIEDRLNNMLYVAESLIISQGGKLVALIYPDWEQVDKAGIQHSEIEKLMQTNIDQVNEEMPNYSKITCFKLYQEEFEKTPKRSIKRYLYQPAE